MLHHDRVCPAKYTPTTTTIKFKCHKNQCHWCRRIFASKLRQQNHVTKHCPLNPNSPVFECRTRFLCGQCKISFKHKNALDTHVRYECGRKLLCQYCRKKFSWRVNLKVHEKKTCKFRPILPILELKKEEIDL